MKLSYKKDFLINYIENDLMIKLFAEFREAQADVRRSIYAYEHSSAWHRFWFEHPKKASFGTHRDWVMYAANDKIDAVKDLLRIFKNADLLNPIVLDDREINLLRL